MKILNTREELRRFHSEHRSQTVGFVPTMGALHEGHLALVKRSVAENDLTVCSIFVNPTQFNNASDLEKYPRTEEQDVAMLEQAGCDVVFLPTVDMMYPQPASYSFDFGPLERVMEGEFRSGHFNGVGVIVSKLFNLVQPDKAYFGQKDLQQCAVIRRMTEDLCFNLDLVICPTVREDDGLAMSSRNRRLTKEHRAQAPALYKALKEVSNHLVEKGTVDGVIALAEDSLEGTDFRLEYLQVVDVKSLQPLNSLENISEVAVCVAAFLGEIRLIDNVLVQLGPKK